MANTAIFRDAHGLSAMFVGSKTGSNDAAFVFIRVSDEKRRLRRAEWGALPASSCMVWCPAFLGRKAVMQ